ncbi:MAG: neutral/alkaline non-lysosomal ceramidase N-terminal domain-containing protein [Opitutaceae bacterium]|nr:neutral/alkaline non-lysosomal ceramidase N-terminal domain-containing protein [Opitutaceae bacterium]
MKTAPLFAAWIVAAAVALPPSFSAAETEWKAGLASVKITPEMPVMMSGYANRIRPFERVEQHIYAKAIVLEDRNGHRAVIVTSDLIGMPSWFAEPLAEQIGAKTGLKREQIMFTWAHNHAGPSLSMKEAPGPGVALTDAKNRVVYTKWLQQRLLELVVNANTRLESAKLSHGRGVAMFVMNRREFTLKGVILGVNPQGPADRSVPVLRIDSPDGKPRAILFGAASHNTTLGSKNYDLCGDYAGFAQHYLESKYPGVQAMFMLGCAGDANPYPRDTMEATKEHGATLGREVARVVETKLRPIGGPLKLVFGHADVPLMPMTKAELAPLAANSPSWQIGNAKQMLAMLERGEKLPTHFRAPIAVWQFGTDLTMVALSGEVVVDYVYFVEKALGPLNLWVAGYTNDGFGYLPSARVIAEGGYENRGLSSGDGWFAPEAQDAIVAKVKELARQVGRSSDAARLSAAVAPR